jgi:hypothetical protein
MFSVGSDDVESGVAEASLESRLAPIELIAEILYVYSVSVVSAVSVCFVLVLWVFRTIVIKSPLPSFTSILYPITGGPLFVAGFIQVRSIDVGDLSWAVSDVGALGTMFSNG